MSLRKKSRNMEDLEIDREIEKVLKEKYDKIVVPDKMFDTSKLWARIEEEQKKRKS